MLLAPSVIVRMYLSAGALFGEYGGAGKTLTDRAAVSLAMSPCRNSFALPIVSVSMTPHRWQYPRKAWTVAPFDGKHLVYKISDDKSTMSAKHVLP